MIDEETTMDIIRIKNPTAIDTIKIGLDQLKRYEKNYNGRKTVQELRWEIRLYEWILAQPDAGEKAKQYLSVRLADVVPMEKREVVKQLGWVIE